jgi:hypothetical protein
MSMKAQNIIMVLCVAAVLAGWVYCDSIGDIPGNRVTQSNGLNVSKHTTFMNGAPALNGLTLVNGAVLSNGVDLALALMDLASRPLAKKD